MKIRTTLLAGGLAFGALLAPATVQACTLTLNNGGTMALSLDGETLGSEEPGGVTAGLLVASIASATLQIDAPTLIEAPTNYDETTDVVEIGYTGTGGLAGVSQTYTDQTTSFNITLLPLTVLSLNARVRNPNSFWSGIYRLRTVVTCY